MDNYSISRDRAQKYFLNFDQAKCIADWQLDHDENWLYPIFIGRRYRICRATGTVQRCWDGTAALYEEALSIFDFLCHDSPVKQLSGNWAPVNSLKGLKGTAGVTTGFYHSLSQGFDADPDSFRAACLALGGTPVPMGDIGFRFPIFGDFHAIVKFYHSDEDFPASTTLLWDENALQYLYYETVYFVAGFLLHTIARQMENQRIG